MAFGNPLKVRFFPELDKGAGPEMGANPEVTGWVLPADWFYLGTLVVFLRSGQYLKIGRSIIDCVCLRSNIFRLREETDFNLTDMVLFYNRFV